MAAKHYMDRDMYESELSKVLAKHRGVSCLCVGAHMVVCMHVWLCVLMCGRSGYVCACGIKPAKDRTLSRIHMIRVAKHEPR